MNSKSSGPIGVAEETGTEETTALTLLEFWTYGHSPNLMRIFLEYWHDHGPGSVRAIVTQAFLDAFPYVFHGFKNIPGSPVRWAAIDPDDEAVVIAAQEFASHRDSMTMERPAGFHASAAFLSSLLDKYSKRYPTRHMLLVNLDEYILSLGAMTRLPVSFSGVIFLPSFFYQDEMAEASFRMRVFNAVQNRVVRTRLLCHPDLRVLFSLDQTVVDGLDGVGTAKVVYLPDPVRIPERVLSRQEAAHARQRLGIPPDRKLFLLFGDLRARKGLWRLFAALADLTPEECAGVAVALVGHAEPEIEERIAAATAALSGKPICMIREKGYVSDPRRDMWFDIADVALTPYIRHVGSSGVLMLAAAHRRPVISQDFGYMGRLTRENRLGITVDSRDPRDIARGLRSFLAEAAPAEWDPDTAYAFAESQPGRRFATVLIESLRPFVA